MLNNRQINVIERNSYVDEFEHETSAEKVSVNSEERAFNAKISDNFDRIIHYDVYNKQADLQEINKTYEKFTANVNNDLNPSSTTMQFKGLPKAEIYQDYKTEQSYAVKTQMRPRAKIMVACMAILICILSVFVVLNSALLNNMNDLIAQKNTTITELKGEKEYYEGVLSEITTPENIIDSAISGGMVK